MSFLLVCEAGRGIAGDPGLVGLIAGRTSETLELMGSAGERGDGETAAADRGAE
jgi:hypothetical protein